jgi:hypothetical protein
MWTPFETVQEYDHRVCERAKRAYTYKALVAKRVDILKLVKRFADDATNTTEKVALLTLFEYLKAEIGDSEIR